MVNNGAKIRMRKKFLLILTLASLSFFMTSCSDPYEPALDPTEMLGDVMFWTDYHLGNGIIYVTFRNATMQITRYYSENPYCGAQGCATYENVPIGTYSFSAKMGMTGWNGEVTVREGQCNTMCLRMNKGEAVVMEEGDDVEQLTDCCEELGNY